MGEDKFLEEIREVSEANQRNREYHENKSKNELKQTKLKLYSLLLKKSNEDLTDTEINIMYELAMDNQVQEVFEEVSNE